MITRKVTWRESIACVSRISILIPLTTYTITLHIQWSVVKMLKFRLILEEDKTAVIEDSEVVQLVLIVDHSSRTLSHRLALDRTSKYNLSIKLQVEPLVQLISPTQTITLSRPWLKVEKWTASITLKTESTQVSQSSSSSALLIPNCRQKEWRLKIITVDNLLLKCKFDRRVLTTLQEASKGSEMRISARKIQPARCTQLWRVAHQLRVTRI